MRASGRAARKACKAGVTASKSPRSASLTTRILILVARRAPRFWILEFRPMFYPSSVSYNEHGTLYHVPLGSHGVEKSPGRRVGEGCREIPASGWGCPHRWGAG